MKFVKTYEKDAGPVVRWIATKLLAIIGFIERPLYNYAEMYEVVDMDGDEDEVYDTRAKYTESFGKDWGEDDDYFEGAAI